MAFILQQLVNSLQLGSIYALIALGYALVYSIIRLINFAHGDIFMVGSFLGFFAAAVLQLSFVPTMLLAMVATAMLGVTIERVAYRPLRAAPRLSAVITALGVGLFLENFTLAVIGPQRRAFPALLPIQTYQAGTVTISTIQIVVVTTAVALMILLDWIVRRTKVGMAMRAISWDKTVVPLMGVNLDQVISITFALGSSIAAAGGVLVGLAYPIIEPYMGILIGWQAFIAAVVGGIGEIRGAMVGGFVLGTVQILTVAFFPSTYRDFIAFALLLLVLVVKPTGILGKPEIRKV